MYTIILPTGPIFPLKLRKKIIHEILTLPAPREKNQEAFNNNRILL